MTTETDPLLLETEGGSLADALADARADVLDSRQLAAVARTLPFMTSGAAAPAASAAKGIAAWKIGLLSAIVVGLGVGAFWLATRPSTSAPTSTTAPLVLDPPTRPPAVQPVVRAEAPVTIEQQVRRQKRPPAIVRRAPSPPPASPAPPEPTLRTELELVSAANAALSSSPQQALARVAEHARLYPNGALAEERDTIRVVALMRAGRVDEARRQAEAFHRRHPQSLHWRRISAAVNPGGP